MAQGKARRTRPPRPYRPAAILDAMVMTLLIESNQPLTAYDIARRSGEKGSRITPAQVYRVLDRLEADRRVQRVELLSAWLPWRDGRHGFMICRECRAVQTLPIGALQATVQRLCRTMGFSPSREVFETWGLCAECDSRRAAANRSDRTGKEHRMPNGMKGMLALMATAGAMLAIVPADAAERRPGVLHDGAGNELGTITVTDAPKGVLPRIEARGLPNIHMHADGSVAVELYSTLISLGSPDGRPRRCGHSVEPRAAAATRFCVNAPAECRRAARKPEPPIPAPLRSRPASG